MGYEMDWGDLTTIRSHISRYAAAGGLEGKLGGLNFQEGKELLFLISVAL